MVFFFLSLLTFLFLFKYKNKSGVKATVFLICLYLLVFTFRSFNVADTEPYYDIFLGDYSDSLEKGFVLVNQFFLNNGFSFRHLLFAIALFNLSIWFFCTKKILPNDNLLVSLLVFMSFAGVYNYGIILRASMADSIMLIAITAIMSSIEKDYKRRGDWLVIIKTLCLLLLAFFFHQTSIVLFFILIVYLFPLNNTIRLLLVLFSMCLFLFPGIATMATGRVSMFIQMNEMRLGNIEDYAGDVRIGLTNIYLAIVSFFYIYCSKFIVNIKERRKYSLVLDLYVIGVLLTALFSHIEAGVRLGLLLTFFEFLMPAILLRNVNGSRRSTIISVVIVFVIMNIVKLLTNVPSLWYYL